MSVWLLFITAGLSEGCLCCLCLLQWALCCAGSDSLLTSNSSSPPPLSCQLAALPCSPTVHHHRNPCIHLYGCPAFSSLCTPTQIRCSKHMQHRQRQEIEKETACQGGGECSVGYKQIKNELMPLMHMWTKINGREVISEWKTCIQTQTHTIRCTLLHGCLCLEYVLYRRTASH